jgi:UDP-N-acetylglucosamine diphosphorylase/glucosamine-1-phosphate N-acetyltransferase
VTLVFVDDRRAGDLAPFALTRPACELRVGAELVRQRWERVLGEPTTGFVGASHLADFEEPGAATAVTSAIPAGSILVNSRCAVSLGAAERAADAWTCNGRVAAVRVRSPVPLNTGSVFWEAAEQDVGGGSVAKLEGHWIDDTWDLIGTLTDCLTSDIPLMADVVGLESSGGVTVLGQHAFLCERGAMIESPVVVDATSGPVLVRRGAHVQAFTRLVGPCLIGEDVVVNGGRISGSSIGERSRVSGEVSTSIFLGHANKAHDGFIGHSVLGRWANLGASTVNSNLKNTYGDVSLWTPRGTEPTGLQFLGTFFGDHAKTAIGTRLTTGTVIGAGANVFGSGTTPKYVPPFSWGVDDPVAWELDAFLRTAERVMSRRQVALTDKVRRQLGVAWRMSQGVTS